MMLDHIIKGGDTVEEARALLPGYGSQDKDGNWHWRGDCVMARTRAARS